MKTKKRKKAIAKKSAEKVLIANSIILKDPRGRTRMCLEAADICDNSRITIFGVNGESISITVDGDSTCMVGMLHTDGKMGAALAVSPKKESRLILSDKLGTPRIYGLDLGELSPTHKP